MTHQSYGELRERLEQARDLVPEALYQHSKTGAVYQVIGYCVLEMSDEIGIRYREAYRSGGAQVVDWVRPITEWNEPVTVHGREVSRFVELDDY